MMPDDRTDRLSRISTQWTMLFQAHGDAADAVTLAQAALLHRYRGGVFRYLLGAVRDPDVAEELAQEFALRFVRGDFRRARPERGRFRDYLKTALSHLVTDHHRARQAGPRQMAPDAPEPAAPLESDGGDDFPRVWREELLERTWEALEQANPSHRAALLLRIHEPDLSSAQMAERLTTSLGKPVTADWVRKALQRAHDKFADLLLDEIAQTIEDDSVDRIEAELRELDLLRYCQSALDRRRSRA